MIKNGKGGANTQSGTYFEQITHGTAPGIPLHKKAFGKYCEEHLNKHYALSGFRLGKIDVKAAITKAKKYEGTYLLSKGLEPDEAYLDHETSTLTIFEKKYQNTDGSTDEKIQTAGFKLFEYQKLAKLLGIEHVYFIYILGDFFKHPYYQDALDFIKSIPNCDYYFFEEN